MTEVVIAGAARTPIGSFNGALSAVPAHVLGEVAIREALARAKTDAAEVDEVILGQILTAGQGQTGDTSVAVTPSVTAGSSSSTVTTACS